MSGSRARTARAAARRQQDKVAVLPSGMPSGESLGARVRELRRLKGVTLATLATRTNVSIGHLSEVERGLAAPSIKLLHDASHALGVQIGWFYQSTGQVRPEERGVVVRSDARRRLSFQGLGITDDLLSPSLTGKLELLLCTFEPGAYSGEEPYSHDGEEAGYVLEGTLELWVGARHFVIEAGDSFTFKSTEPHRYGNPGKRKAVVVWAITPPTF